MAGPFDKLLELDALTPEKVTAIEDAPVVPVVTVSEDTPPDLDGIDVQIEQDTRSFMALTQALPMIESVYLPTMKCTVRRFIEIINRFILAERVSYISSCKQARSAPDRSTLKQYEQLTKGRFKAICNGDRPPSDTELKAIAEAIGIVNDKAGVKKSDVVDTSESSLTASYHSLLNVLNTTPQVGAVPTMFKR